MAVDPIRQHSRIIDIGAAEKPRARSLLGLAGSFGEISNSFFVAGRHWELSTVVTPRSRNESWPLHCDGGSQPALYSANDAYGSSGHCLGGSNPSSGPSLFAALQEQLGLELESQTGPVPLLVIDHVEMPSEN
jgi:hypothetical protein